VSPTFDAEWDRCAAWLEAALRHAGGTHTLDDVKAVVNRHEARFWAGRNAAMVTEINTYPQFAALNFWLAGGDLAELRDELRPAAEAWAKSLGCRYAAVVGRLGWARALGYRPIHHTCAKEL
jgi:hypothetical protein